MCSFSCPVLQTFDENIESSQAQLGRSLNRVVSISTYARHISSGHATETGSVLCTMIHDDSCVVRISHATPVFDEKVNRFISNLLVLIIAFFISKDKNITNVRRDTGSR